MWQRIQTLYIVVAFALCIACLCTPLANFVVREEFNQTGAYAGFWDGYDRVEMYNLWLTSGFKRVFYFCPILMALLVITAALVFLDIWLYKQRALQMRIATFCMILLVAWNIAYGAVIYLLMSNLMQTWRPHWTAALPAVALILLYLAFRGILKDEMLVRSLDRLR
ncbi:MAG: DUF4293 domain-containing protein [Bacteroidaceae bacterium]|nr:DUF4293 domain-containing protein [Bacteroidaceae bacterium]